jgi:hypothetical protein
VLEDGPGNSRENRRIKHKFPHRNTLLGHSCNSNRINLFVKLKLCAFSWEVPGENRLSLIGNSRRKKLDKICGFEQERTASNGSGHGLFELSCVAFHSRNLKADGGYSTWVSGFEFCKTVARIRRLRRRVVCDSIRGDVLLFQEWIHRSV